MRWLVSLIIEVIFNKLVSLVKKEVQDEQINKDIKAQAKADGDQLKNAKTEDEIKKAAQTIAKDF